MSEQVEWEIVHLADEGPKRHNEGAQSRFGLTRAQGIAKTLGPPWYVIHHQTQLQPDEHAEWLKGGGQNWSA